MRLFPKRDPNTPPDHWVAFSLNALFLPGLGQVYRGQRKKGWFFILLSLATLIYTLAKFMMGVLQVVESQDYPRPPHLNILKILSAAFSLEKITVVGGFILLMLLWLWSLWDIRHYKMSLPRGPGGATSPSLKS